MPSYKLTYFEGRGRAEAIRMLFSLAGVEFEDNRIKKEQWETLKPKSRYGFLPELEIDGKVFGHSNAILHYIAREYGYYGKTNLESMEVDQVLYTMEDLLQAAIKVYHGPEQGKEERTKEFVEVHMPKHFGLLEKILKDNGSGFFVGKSATVADVLICAVIPQFVGRHSGCTDAFPLLQENIKKTESLERVKAYMDKRPQDVY